MYINLSAIVLSLYIPDMDDTAWFAGILRPQGSNNSKIKKTEFAQEKLIHYFMEKKSKVLYSKVYEI